MEVLQLDGKNYVKSSAIARELGYTSDYVGQLCRSGKVDAKLFGRTWYVENESIRGHKTTRYRSSAAVTKRVLKTQLDGPATTKVATHHLFTKKTPRPAEEYEHFYEKMAKKKVSYDTDQSPLMPSPKKRLTVELADASSLKVTAEKSKYTFETPSLPEIRFRGKLRVEEYRDNGVPEEAASSESAAAGVHLQRKRESVRVKVVEKAGKIPQNIAISSVLKNSLKRILSVRTADSKDITSPLEVSVSDHSLVKSVLYGLLFGFVPGILCVFVILTTGVSLSATQASVERDFYFDIKNLEQLSDLLFKNF